MRCLLAQALTGFRLVVGMQYYHSACIFLTLSDIPSHCMTDYEIARSKRAKEVCRSTIPTAQGHGINMAH